MQNTAMVDLLLELIFGKIKDSESIAEQLVLEMSKSDESTVAATLGFLYAVLGLEHFHLKILYQSKLYPLSYQKADKLLESLISERPSPQLYVYLEKFAVQLLELLDPKLVYCSLTVKLTVSLFLKMYQVEPSALQDNPLLFSKIKIDLFEKITNTKILSIRTIDNGNKNTTIDRLIMNWLGIGKMLNAFGISQKKLDSVSKTEVPKDIDLTANSSDMILVLVQTSVGGRVEPPLHLYLIFINEYLVFIKPDPYVLGCGKVYYQKYIAQLTIVAHDEISNTLDIIEYKSLLKNQRSKCCTTLSGNDVFDEEVIWQARIVFNPEQQLNIFRERFLYQQKTHIASRIEVIKEYFVSNKIL
ncbi:hypothetical protein HDV01_007754 [Terramyces sp. JEL0728]|nr:hypothetical protein HDV01_007754 [Terramyces sp. JEL0728]